MALDDWFGTEFWLLETRVAMAKDASAALVELISRVEKEKRAMSSAQWRRQVKGILDSLELKHLGLTVADEAQPPLARSPMQGRKRRFIEAAIVGLTYLLAKPSP